jgi:hypothetical protein
MRNFFRNYSKYALGLLIFMFVFSLVCCIGTSGLHNVAQAKITQGTIISDEEPIALDKTNPQIQAVMAVQNRHTKRLMANPDVVGTATGLTASGKPAVVVLTKKMLRAGLIPESLEGISVVVQVTGEIISMKGRPSGKSKNTIDPTKRFDRPMPIGISTGNAGECSAGTIGARVRDNSGNVYALSNNHVYALENAAPIGSSQVLQPGLYDTNCIYDANNVIGTLSDFITINFAGGDNEVDAAIARSSKDILGNSTPSNGYGTPKSTTVLASVNQAVQKYGRTTSLTKGTVTGINAIVDVSYSSGTARFINQIVVSSLRPFIKPGDSGSLLVTDPGRNPVGLLFAGNGSGKLAIANPIDKVLDSLDVTIDGK